MPASFLNCPSCARQIQVPPQSSYQTGYPQQGTPQQPAGGGMFSQDQRIASPPQPQAPMPQQGMMQQPQTGMQQPQQYPQQGAPQQQQVPQQPAMQQPGMQQGMQTGGYPTGQQQPAQKMPQAASISQTSAPAQSATQAPAETTQAPRSEAWSEPVESSPSVSVQASRGRSAGSVGERAPGGLNAWILGLLGMIAVLALAIIGIVMLQDGDKTPARDAQVDAWLREIRSARTPEQRLQAIGRLAERGPHAVADVLDRTISLGDDTAGFSEHIIDGLSMLPESRILPILDAAITSSRPNVRVGAAMIARIMGPRAKSLSARLAQAGKDKNQWVRWYSLDAISAMGPEASSVVGQLIQLFRHRDNHTQRRAIEAVGKIGPLARVTRPDLSRILRDIASDSRNSTELRGYASAALRQVGE